MIGLQKIDHVAIAVADMDAAIDRMINVLQLSAPTRETVASQKTEAALFSVGDSKIELIASQGNEGLTRFLDKRGPGIHHICFQVQDIANVLTILKVAGVPLIDETP